MKSFPLPPGYTWKFGRGVEQNDETVQTMLINIAARVRDDLPGHGRAVRVHAPAGLDPHLDRVRDRRRVLVPVRDARRR